MANHYNHENAGRPRVYKERCAARSVNLTQTQADQLTRIGKGNFSAGVRKALKYYVDAAVIRYRAKHPPADAGQEMLPPPDDPTPVPDHLTENELTVLATSDDDYKP